MERSGTGFRTLGTVDILGRIIPCCGAPSCALWGDEQPPWLTLLPTL